jgi:predicted O-methyltransferase YrrM
MASENIIVAAVESYMNGLLPARDAILQEMEQQAEARDIAIVGPAVARILYQYAKIIGARKIFELGSAIGYSTLWWARAVGQGGQVFYTDSDRENAAEAKGYFERAGVADRVQIQLGDALELFSEQKQEFDIIFNDVDKEDYPRVLHMAPARLRRGGLFITDNALWYGRVTQTDPTEDSTRAVKEFNQRLYSMPEFFTTILPIRDGVAVAVKL